MRQMNHELRKYPEKVRTLFITKAFLAVFYANSIGPGNVPYEISERFSYIS